MATVGPMAGPDVRDAGAVQAARLKGLNQRHPLISSRAKDGRYDVDSGFSRIQTSDGGPNNGPLEMPDARLLDDWRDALNPQSPAFWLLLFVLAIVGFMQFRVQVGGKRGARVGLG